MRIETVSLLLAGVTAVVNVPDIQPWGTDSARIRFPAPGQDLSDPVISALLPDPPAGTPPSLRRLESDSTHYAVANGNLRVDVNKSTGFVTISRVSDGVTLLQQTGLVWGDATSGSNATMRSATIDFAGLNASERVYGLGEHRTGTVQLAPYDKVFADSLYYRSSHGGDVSIPWYCTTRGLGFVWNLPSLGSVALRYGYQRWVSNATRGIDFWVTTTPATLSEDSNEGVIPSLLSNYAAVVGRPKAVPFWATGFIQCKNRYRNQTQLLEVARGYVERGLPISMIVIDWFHWRNMGDWSLNPTCWPDPQAMVDELRGMGIELMITVWPFMGMPYKNGTLSSANYKEFEDRGFLAQSTQTNKTESIWGFRTPTGNALVDATSSDAMAAVTAKWYQGYGKYGVKAIWMDESEPDHSGYISGGQWRLVSGMDTELLPAWVKYWSKGFQSKFEELGLGDDFFVLSRNGWAGTAGQGAAMWSGDISSTFDELRIQVRVGQGVGLSGVPLWTTDIGGFGGGNPDDPSFQQLIVRWFQFGAFCPIFRLHGTRGGSSVEPPNECGMTNGDNEVWNLAKDPAHYAAIEAVMRLREDLRDYVRRLSLESAQTGMPIMRSMVLVCPTDDECWSSDAEGQFALGPDWIVAPVTTENATTWPVYLPALPANETWVYWWNQTQVTDSQSASWRSVDVRNIGDFPLFFKRPIA